MTSAWEGQARRGETRRAYLGTRLPVLGLVMTLLGMPLHAQELRRSEGAVCPDGEPCLGAVRGRVTTRQGDPIGSAMVRVLGDTTSARTASDGTFRLVRAGTGGVTLEVSRFGYESRRIALDTVSLARDVLVELAPATGALIARVDTVALKGRVVVRAQVTQPSREVAPETRGSVAIRLRVETERRYGCLLPLLHRFTLEGKTLALHLDGVPTPAVCPAAEGPASLAVQTELPPGTYTLQVLVGDQTDRYRMIVGTRSVRLLARGVQRVSRSVP